MLVRGFYFILGCVELYPAPDCLYFAGALPCYVPSGSQLLPLHMYQQQE